MIFTPVFSMQILSFFANPVIINSTNIFHSIKQQNKNKMNEKVIKKTG